MSLEIGGASTMLWSYRRVLFAVACLGLATGLPTTRADQPKKPRLEFRRAETKPAEGLTEASVPGQPDKIYLHKDAELTEDDVTQASVGVDLQGGPCIDIVFTKKGAEKMAKLSEAQIDKPLAVLVDGKVISAPIVKSKFSDRASITGFFTKPEAEQLVKAIKPK
jgi:preprotein translocase subunit SecD